MGNMQASEFAAAVEDGQISIEGALRWHLTSNHFPPVPVSMIEPCKAAIEAVEDEDEERQIALPEGVTYQGSVTAPAWAIVEQLHLESFIDA